MRILGMCCAWLLVCTLAFQLAPIGAATPTDLSDDVAMRLFGGDVYSPDDCVLWWDSQNTYAWCGGGIWPFNCGTVQSGYTAGGTWKAGDSHDPCGIWIWCADYPTGAYTCDS